jgi:hypothetical protein
MVESARCHFSAGTDRERDQHELIRLGEVEGFIQKRAAQFARDDAMLAEDLTQQAREAVIRRLREQPDCPYSHLINKARDAIYRYRGKGNSVDGLLYQRGRARQYDIISLEQPINNEVEFPEEKCSLREVLSEPNQPRRVTEERASTQVLLDTVRDQLCPYGNSALTLRLQGLTWKEIRTDLNLSDRMMERIKRDLVQRIQGVWG